MNSTGEGIPLRLRIQNFDATFKIDVAAKEKAPGFSCDATIMNLFKQSPDPDRVKSFSHVIECNNALIVVF